MMDTTMAAVLSEIMSIQADEACGASYGERSDARVNSRNGYWERKLETTVGALPLMVPKLRSGSYFPTDLFERWSRTDRALAAAVAEMYRVPQGKLIHLLIRPPAGKWFAFIGSIDFPGGIRLALAFPFSCSIRVPRGKMIAIARALFSLRKDDLLRLC